MLVLRNTGSDMRHFRDRNFHGSSHDDDATLWVLVQRVGRREDDKSRRLQAATQLQEFVKKPENRQILSRNLDLMLNSLIDVFFERSGTTLQKEVATIIALVGQYLSNDCYPFFQVEEAIRAKKDAFKALLQNRSSSDLQFRYAEARKAASLAVKKSKEKSWEEFGRCLNSNYTSANKVFWQTIRCLHGKRSNATTSVNDSEGNILSNETDIIQIWREYFDELLNPSKGNHP